MTFDLFWGLLPNDQLLYALNEGTYLAQRWEEEGATSLYYLADGGRGFFVEMGIDKTWGRYIVRRSFSRSMPLEKYAYYVRLPSEL